MPLRKRTVFRAGARPWLVGVFGLFALLKIDPGFGYLEFSEGGGFGLCLEWKHAWVRVRESFLSVLAKV